MNGIELLLIIALFGSCAGITTYTVLPSSSPIPTTISSNTQLAIANSPYSITADVTVTPGTTLLIDPGVIVYFSYATNLIIGGTIIANGNSTQQILFTAANTSFPWGGLQLLVDSMSLSYLNLTYGGLSSHDCILYVISHETS